MNACSSLRRARRWLMLLAMLLPLHAGLAQAAMVMPMRAASVGAAHEVDAVDAAAVQEPMPCHGEAAPDIPESPAMPGSPAKHGCCDLASCHCVAACGLTFATAGVIVQRLLFHPPIYFLSVPATAHPPDLRPPIG